MAGLSEDFEDFLDYEMDVFQRIENKYSKHLRQCAEDYFKSQIPKGNINSQVRWLESRFYELKPEFKHDKFQTETFDCIYSSLLLQERDNSRYTLSKDNLIQSKDLFESYDTVVLDHSIIFEILEKDERSYYLDGKNVTTWEDTLNVLDEAVKKSEIYIPSDIVDKNHRKNNLGRIKPAKLFLEGFNTLQMDQDINVPGGHEHMEEDMIIGSQAEKLGKNVLILSYDSDFFSAVPHHYDINPASPILKK